METLTAREVGDRVRAQASPGERLVLARGFLRAGRRPRCRIGIFAVGREVPALLVDAWMAPVELDELESLLRDSFPLDDGRWDPMFALAWSRVWTEAPAPFTLWTRAGRDLWVQDGVLHGRGQPVARERIRGIELTVAPDWVERGLKVRHPAGEATVLVTETDHAPSIDPTYDRFNLDADTSDLARLGRDLAAALGVPFVNDAEDVPFVPPEPEPEPEPEPASQAASDPQSPPSSPREAIARHCAGDLDGDGLLRTLVSWEWIVPAGTEGGQVYPKVTSYAGGEGRWLESFSDQEALRRWEEETGRTQELTLTVAGTWVVDQLREEAGIDGWNIDPLGDHAIHYRRPQLPLLRRWGRTILVERILGGEKGVAGSAALLREHEYRIVVSEADRSRLVLAPDVRGRKLAAICTAPDCLRAFWEGHVAPLGVSARVLTLPGTELFRLLADLPLDGMVFNPLGPPPPKGLAIRFAKVMLGDR